VGMHISSGTSGGAGHAHFASMKSADLSACDRGFVDFASCSVFMVFVVFVVCVVCVDRFQLDFT
jgi:hypothetical protein